MPRAKKSGTQNAGGRTANGEAKLRWLNITLDGEDIDTVVSLASSTDELAHDLVGLIATGGNFSVRHNPDKGNFSCFLSDTRGNSDGTGFGISASANTPIAAVAAALVKLRVWKLAPERFTSTGGDLGIR